MKMAISGTYWAPPPALEGIVGGSSGSTGSGPTVSAGSTASAEARDLWAVEVPVEISGKSMDELV